MKTASLRGVGLTMAAAALWGTTGTAQSFAPGQTSPYWVGALRLLISSVFFGVATLVSARAVGLRPAAVAAAPWSRAAWRSGVLAGVCIAVYNLSFFAGVKASGVALGTALAIVSGPVWAGLLQALVLRRGPSRAWWLGTVLAVAGGVLMMPRGGPATRVDVAGLLLCLAAGLSYAAYTLVSQGLVSQVSPTAATFCTFGVAALVAWPVAYGVAGAFKATAAAWWVVGYLGVVATGVSFLLFSHGLRHISGATAVTLAMIEPVTAFVLAVAVVGEHPAARAFAGLALVLAGLVVVVCVEARRPGGG